MRCWARCCQAHLDWLRISKCHIDEQKKKRNTRVLKLTKILGTPLTFILAVTNTFLNIIFVKLLVYFYSNKINQIYASYRLAVKSDFIRAKYSRTLYAEKTIFSCSSSKWYVNQESSSRIFISLRQKMRVRYI